MKRLLDFTSRNINVGQVAQEKLVDVRGEGAIHLMGVNTKGIAQYKKYMLHPTWQLIYEHLFLRYWFFALSSLKEDHRNKN